MCGYQSHFRINVAIPAKSVFDRIGEGMEPHALPLVSYGNIKMPRIPFA